MSRALVALCVLEVHGFVGTGQFWNHRTNRRATSTWRMALGWGETEAYRWREQVDELEVTIRVPTVVESDAVQFQVTSRSIFLATDRDAPPLIEV